MAHTVPSSSPSGAPQGAALIALLVDSEASTGGTEEPVLQVLALVYAYVAEHAPSPWDPETWQVTLEHVPLMSMASTSSTSETSADPFGPELSTRIAGALLVGKPPADAAQAKAAETFVRGEVPFIADSPAEGAPQTVVVLSGYAPSAPGATPLFQLTIFTLTASRAANNISYALQTSTFIQILNLADLQNPADLKVWNSVMNGVSTGPVQAQPEFIRVQVAIPTQ